jgi:hypothetical protein
MTLGRLDSTLLGDGGTNLPAEMHTNATIEELQYTTAR